jgi:hypothetical protein
MSAAAGRPVVVDCAACDLEFDAGTDAAEAAHVAGVHNELHHGGRPVAVPVDADVVEAAGELFGEQAREQAAEDVAQGQGGRWLNATAGAGADDVDEAGW